MRNQRIRFRIIRIKSDERYQMKTPESLKRIDIQHNRENDDPVDTYIDLKINVVKTLN